MLKVVHFNCSVWMLLHWMVLVLAGQVLMVLHGLVMAIGENPFELVENRVFCLKFC